MNAPLKLAAVQRAASPADECAVDYGRACPTIPEGEYKAVFTHHETAFVFKTPKVFLWFRLIDPGPHFGTMIYAAHIAKNLTGKPGRNGGIKLTARGDLFLMVCRVLDMRARPDRFSLRGLLDRVLRVKVRTVKTDYRQRPLPEALQYSKVEEIIGCDTG